MFLSCEVFEVEIDRKLCRFAAKYESEVVIGEWGSNLLKMSRFCSPGMQPVKEMHRSISAKRYMPLSLNGINGFLNVIPTDIRKSLPKFIGNLDFSASHHVELFIDFMGDYEIAHEDVHMKLFVQNLEGDARDWFSFLLVCSISSWN